MHDEDLQQLATRIERRTDRILIVSGAMFLIWQVSYFVIFNQRDGALRTVDVVASAGFIAWAGALLMMLATGGGVFANREVQDILDDELARSYRARAYRNGFWALMLIALAAYVAAQVTSISARPLAHVSLSAGVLVAVATLAYLRLK
jgi:hypothetical protein